MKIIKLEDSHSWDEEKNCMRVDVNIDGADIICYFTREAIEDFASANGLDPDPMIAFDGRRKYLLTFLLNHLEIMDTDNVTEVVITTEILNA
ncbi:MAG: DUF1488 family protein [Deltaproteobacteria bacterium]|nr:DUF1488 family protein [Deltaproteobacteria bacterium]